MRILLTILLLPSLVFGQSKIPINTAFIFDWSGNDVHGGGGNRGANWFDGNATIDPKNGDVNFNGNGGDATSAVPFRNAGTYFPKGISTATATNYRGDRNLRILIDLGADTSVTALNKYNITDVYGLDKTFEVGDSLLGYNMDQYFIDTLNKPARLKYLVRHDSLCTPAFVLTTNSGASVGGSWRSATGLNFNCRWLLLVVKRKDRGAYYSYADFYELVIYGTKVGSWTSSGLPTYAGSLPTKRTYSNHFGSNQGVYTYKDALAYDNVVRQYASEGDIDTQNAPWPTNQYDGNQFGLSGSLLHYPDSLQQRGHFTYISFAGGSRYVWNQLGATGNFNKMAPVDDCNNEPEYIESYDNLRDFAKHIGARYGRNTAGLTIGDLRWTDMSPSGLGLQWYDGFQFGNEDFARMTPLAIYAKNYMSWKGFREADTISTLIMPSTIFFDSMYVKCELLWIKLFTNEQEYFFDAIAMHHYSRTTDNAIDYTPTADQNVGAKGQVPEANLLNARMTAYGKSARSWLAAYGHQASIIEFYYDEYGYGNKPDSPSNATEAGSTYDIGGTPMIPNYSNHQSKAITLERAEEIMFQNPWIQIAVKFMIHNSSLTDTTGHVLFENYGDINGDVYGNVTPPYYLPAWYVRAGDVAYKRNYKPESVIRSDSIWITKGRHSIYTDSVYYSVWSAQSSTDSVSVILSVGDVAGNAKKVITSFTSVAGTESTQSVSSGSMPVFARQRMATYFLKEVDEDDTMPSTRAIRLKRSKTITR